jgi:hypothetical protein
MATPGDDASPTRVGRYVLFDEIASGGMGTVHLGRQDGLAGFTRCVAVKALHPHLAKDPQFVAMFLDEARLAARVRHPNVTATLDVIADDGRLLIVMEYVHGVSLARLTQMASEAGERIPLEVATSILYGSLQGLHAVHEARAEGEALGMVHRDVSPQNIVVGVDGVARLLDFGVAKAIGRLTTTEEGRIKGKISYMAPEQLLGGLITRQVDVYAASVVLWEALTGKRLFGGDDEALERALQRALKAEPLPPSASVSGLPPGLDDVVMRGLARDRKARFGTARQMAVALGEVCPPVAADVVGEYVERMAHGVLAVRADRIRSIELQPLKADAADLIRAVTAPSGVNGELLNTEPHAMGAVPLAGPRGPEGSSAPLTGVSSGIFGDEAKIAGLARRRPSPLAVAIAGGLVLGLAGLGSWRIVANRRPAPSSVEAADSTAALGAPPQGASVPALASAVAPSSASSDTGSGAALQAQAASPPATATAAAAAVRAPRRLPPARMAKPCKARQVRDGDGIIRWIRDC